MTDNSWTWHFDRAIPSVGSVGTDLISDVLSELRKVEWQEDELFGVHLALEEAVMNAIKHGNQGDEAKEVVVKCKATSSRFWVEITDQGEGFEREEVPDPTDDENLDKPSGRGLMLMENFMTFVQFSDRGNSVVMQKDRA